MNPVKRVVKAVSYPSVRQKRAALSTYLKKNGISLEFFNGGGTGNVSLVADERALSEV